jgi:hypothetical protein
MDITTAFPSRWLTAAGDVGTQTLQYTIRNATMEVMAGRDGSGDVEKPVVWFNDTDKGLVLNKTNSSTIANVLGVDTDRWAGHRLELFTITTSYGAGIRVRVLTTPTPAQPQGQVELNDDINF